MDSGYLWVENLSRPQLEEILIETDKLKWQYYWESVNYRDWAGNPRTIETPEGIYSFMMIPIGVIVPFHLPEVLFSSRAFIDGLGIAIQQHRYTFGKEADTMIYQDEIRALSDELNVDDKLVIANLNEQIAGLRRDLQSLESAKAELETEIEEFEARITRFAQLIHAAENEARALKTQLQQANQTIKELRAKQDYSGTPDGCVYIIKSPMGEYKIGKTKNLQARFAQLQTGSPLKLKFILSIVTDDMDNLEARLHRRFADKRGIGEWFAIDDKDIRAIRKEYSDWLVELD